MKILFTSLCLLLFTLSLPAQEINHVVICWYDASIEESTIKKATKAAQEFKQIPGILSVKVGPPIPSERDIVDDSFSMGIYILAKDQASLAAYVVHPIHVDFVKNFVKGKTKRVTVYDF